METALAILTENTDGLKTLWLSSEDDEKIGLISRGENICSQIIEMNDPEIFLAAYKILKLRSIEKLIAKLNSMPLDEEGLQELVSLYQQQELYSR